MPIGHYTTQFYEEHRDGARRSAEVVAPLVLELLRCRSIVDVGCGDGNWLAVFCKLGIQDVLGIDGDHVERHLLQIPQNSFRPADLSQPFDLGRSFDLAISLEVAEHLSPACAEPFVESLTRLAQFVLFSAAIPSQGGENHLNEQWPDVWVALFRQHGFVPVDFIRRQVWDNEAVDWWYAQNILLFARTVELERNAALKTEFERTSLHQLRLVHPKRYLAAVAPPPPPIWSVKTASRLLITCLSNAIMKRIRRT